VASLLLSTSAMTTVMLATTGCLNPTFFTEVEAEDNHAPEVTLLAPVPSFNPLKVNVGAECRVERVVAQRLDDADGDLLSFRYSLVVNRPGTDGVDVVLMADDLPRKEPLVGEESPYDFPTLELNRALLEPALGDLQFQANGTNGQLLVLRISDRGFSTSGEARAGAALLFFSWAIQLTDVACNPHPT
jgi:hypothetical protein